MVQEDVVPSKQPWWRVVGREWPLTGASSAEITKALADTQYAQTAQAAIWRLLWADAGAGAANLLNHAEVWETDGKVTMITSHVYEGESAVAAAAAWAGRVGVDFAYRSPAESWHNNDAERGCHLFLFIRKA